MRKKRLMIAIACIILVGIAVIVFFSQQGKKPYKDLDAAQIVSAKVLLTPPDKTIEIENIQELVEYLNDVVVYNEDNSYTEYDGQGVVFTLTMVDGTQTDIMAYNPFIVIDGIGYKTKYEPCEALNSYANELLKQEKFAEARRAELTLWDAANRYLHANLPKGTKTLPIAEWEQEYADLKTQRDSDYTKLKETRAEVAELQKIRRCVDIALRADQPEQTQNRTKRHDIDR